jgi:hypothetical protein
MPALSSLHCRQRDVFDGGERPLQEYFTVGNIHLLTTAKGKQWTQTVSFGPFKRFISFSLLISLPFFLPILTTYFI